MSGINNNYGYGGWANQGWGQQRSYQPSQSWGGGSTFYNRQTNTYYVNGTSGNDRIIFSGNTVSVNGQPYRTVPQGARVVVNGYDGNDVIHASYARLSSLEAYGGRGQDVVIGTRNNDAIYGGSGNDALNGWAGNDAIYGGYGNDILYGGSGYNYLNGGPGYDTYPQYVNNCLGPYGMGPYASSYGNGCYHFAGNCSSWQPPCPTRWY